MAGMITALILLPLVGALFRERRARESGPRNRPRIQSAQRDRGRSLLWRNFDTAAAGLQLVERHAWIPAIGAEYLVGDRWPESAAGSPDFARLSVRVARATACGRGFCALMLIMQAALYGTFTAQNFVLWFLFYEMSLIPAFLLIKIWGGENRDRAATKFFVYTFLGSVAMLLAFPRNLFRQGRRSISRARRLSEKPVCFPATIAWLAFAGIFLGLAVKVPLFPFHTWLPDAYETAPVGVSMVLTGVLSKMGVYGFVRLLLPLFPHEIKMLGPWLLGLAVCSIVFRLARRLGANGPETHGRLPFDQSSRLLHARAFRRHRDDRPRRRSTRKRP